MFVNPFWLGVLMTIVAEIMLAILMVIIQGAKGNHENSSEIKEIELPEELQKLIAEEIRKQERGERRKDG